MNILQELTDRLHTTPVMPALFLGHGSPMIAVEENEFVQGFRQTARTIKAPKAILCISANGKHAEHE